MQSYKTDDARITGLSWEVPISEGYQFLFGAYRFTIRPFDNLLVLSSQLPLYIFTREDDKEKTRLDNFAFDNKVILYHEHKEFPPGNWDLRESLPWEVDKSLDYLKSKGSLIKKMFDDNLIVLPMSLALSAIIQDLKKETI